MEHPGPPRALTDLAAPHQVKPHRTIPHRLHTGHLRSKGYTVSDGSHHHRLHRHHAKDAVQSAIEPRAPISFDHLLRRDRRSPNSSIGDTSGLQQRLDGARAGRGTSYQQIGQVRAPPAVTAEDVEKAKADNVKRDGELRESLKKVEEIGMSSTRQLDDTYYSILEKASILRSTVGGLQQLADDSRKMQSSFREDAKKLEIQTQQNVDVFGNFNQQERTVDGLVDKLQQSRTRTDVLKGRLESARLRVEAFETREKEKDTRRRQRLYVLYAILSAVLVLLLSVILARNRRAVGLRLDAVGQQLAYLGDVAEEVASPLHARLRPSPHEDPHLRKLFETL